MCAPLDWCTALSSRPPHILGKMLEHEPSHLHSGKEDGEPTRPTLFTQSHSLYLIGQNLVT